MGAFYGRKIINGEMNPKTGETWKMEDVREFWKKDVSKYLEEHTKPQKKGLEQLLFLQGENKGKSCKNEKKRRIRK